MIILTIAYPFSELAHSAVMQRLLCDQGFNEIIAEVAKMSVQRLNNHLKGIKFSDSEIQPKLELLGVASTKIEYQMTFVYI